jgi:hypothetical protein
MRTRLWVIAAVAVCAATTQAGEIGTFFWPSGFIPQEVADIPVVMDSPWWASILDPDDLVIRLLPLSAYEYEGCTDIVFGAHGDLNISAEFIPTGAVAGTFSVGLSAPILRADEDTLRICVKLKMEAPLPPAETDVRVGTVRLRISPRP